VDGEACGRGMSASGRQRREGAELRRFNSAPLRCLPLTDIPRPVKAFPYSIPSVGPGTDPGVQAVNPQMTVSHPPGGRLPLLSDRPAVTSTAA